MNPPTELIVTPEASSLMLSFARMIAPALLSFSTMNASSGGSDPAKSSEPAVVGMSAVSMLSLSATGMPCNGERGPLILRSSSRILAVSKAWSFSQSTAFRRGPS